MLIQFCFSDDRIDRMTQSPKIRPPKFPAFFKVRTVAIKHKIHKMNILYNFLMENVLFSRSFEICLKLRQVKDIKLNVSSLHPYDIVMNVLARYRQNHVLIGE